MKKPLNKQYLIFSILKKLQELHNDLPFLTERKKIEKTRNLVTNLHGKTVYFIHMTNLKQTLNHRVILKVLNLIKKLG